MSEDRQARLERFAALAEEETQLVPRAEYVSRTRRSILASAAAIAAGTLGWGWVQHQAEDDNIPTVVRRGLETNERLWSALHDPDRLAPEFPLHQAEPIRVNGRLGLREEIDTDTWACEVVGPDGGTIERIGMEVIAGLPQVDQVTEHKCIEGWSNIVHWTGARFAALADRYADDVGRARYVALETPDDGYYVGLDRDTMMHPQTLLAVAWNGQPLTQERGAPLRLVTPLHYGIKSLKRIGRIRFTDERPRDYWAERGYDWDSSH